MKTRLFVSSAIFSLPPAIGVLLANIYWIRFGAAGDYAQYLPESIWDDVFPIMLQCLVAQVVFLAIFFVPVLKMGKKAFIAYLIVNFLSAAFATLIFSTMVNPSNYAGWGYISLILLAGAPVILGLTLGIQALIASAKAKKTSH